MLDAKTYNDFAKKKSKIVSVVHYLFVNLFRIGKHTSLHDYGADPEAQMWRASAREHGNAAVVRDPEDSTCAEPRIHVMPEKTGFHLPMVPLQSAFLLVLRGLKNRELENLGWADKVGSISGA